MCIQKKSIPLIEMYHMNAKDIAELHGCHIQTARRKLREIKKALGKNYNQLVSLEEFAQVEGYSIEILQHFKKQQFS